MPRTKFRPHAEVHHEEDGWHTDLFDFDPIRGLILIGTVVAVSAAAAWLTVDRFRRLLGGAP